MSDPYVHTGRKTRPVVVTPAGAVRGVRHEVGEVYRAVPYAVTPAGAGRFAAPVPHPGWAGVRDGTLPSATAPQPARDFGRLDMSPYFGPGWVPGEYLTVDVHTPAADDGRRPVMVFVHGGGFITGSTSAALYDGRSFARDGVVLVTVNYRLGVPGFLDLPGAPPNRGLLDVLAALAWVRDTAAVFGGDPGNVTVFGQSAGATLVGALLASPRARGLFRRAIMQSGSGAGAFTPEQAARVTAALAEVLDVAPEAFAEVPDERFVEALPSLAGLDLRTATAADPLAGLSQLGLVLPVQPADAVRDGPAADVDLLIGTNTEEGRLYLIPRGNHDSGEAESLGAVLFGDGTKRMIEAHAGLGRARTHVYSFGYRSTALDGHLGAAHTVELPFVFDVADDPVLHGANGLLGPGAAPERLAAEVHGAWIAFARDGDPGWDGYEPDRPAVKKLGH